jgi:UDP-N-acetylmuramate: L-alanyl-gamma-D-glutamyl-meso-diaminopimelate ligase
VAALDGLNLKADDIKKGVSSFKNVKRRLEKIGEVNGIAVYDDFAHHPTAIRKTIAGVKKAHPGKRVIALFEPRSNTSRRNYFQDDLADALTKADVAVIGKVYNYEKMDEAERLDPYKLVKSIRKTKTQAHYMPNVDELGSFVADSAKGGDVIIVMSSGSFYRVHNKILRKLKERYVG